MISLGVPAGATSICQEVRLKPVIPASAMVGISGATGRRVADDTASARTLPSRSSGSTGVGSPNIIGMCPATRLVSAGLSPRNGTCRTSMPVMLLSNSKLRCCGEPGPAEP